MRAGYKNQFRYASTEKSLQLTGMSRYEFGNAANEGSGESSVNLLTGSYIGKWNFYDEKKQKSVAVPTIKTNITLFKTYLESFSEETYFDYAVICKNICS